MPLGAPLQVTVEIALGSGPATGQRRFRLCNRIELAERPTLLFSGGLPVEGAGEATVRFGLPPADGADTIHWIDAAAEIVFDPEFPEQGSIACLTDLEARELEAIETYIDTRLQTAK